MARPTLPEDRQRPATNVQADRSSVPTGEGDQREHEAAVRVEAAANTDADDGSHPAQVG